jgi:hypothetical protein
MQNITFVQFTEVVLRRMADGVTTETEAQSSQTKKP